jgi:probable F420-dependent oxidoreductase
MRDVKFGLFSITGDYAQALKMAKRADGQGFYSILLNDHFFSPFRPPREPQLECFTTLSAIAAVTTKIRIGSLVAAIGFRSPALLAKIASTLDHVSNGRMVLGLGAGWEREEYDAHNYPYPSNSERLDQLADAIKLIKAMWTQDAPTYHGAHFSIDKAYNNPRPLQKPYPPIMLGGSGSKLLKIAAAEADIANLIPPIFNGKDLINDPAAAVRFDKPELKRRIARLHGLAKEAGRDPRDIELSGLSLVTVSKDKHRVDAAVAEVAKRFGFPDAEAARRAPSILGGTPDELRREIRSRIEEIGVTYFVVLPDSEDSHDLFAREVMPEFLG